MPWIYRVKAKCKAGQEKVGEHVMQTFGPLLGNNDGSQISGSFDDASGTFTMEFTSNDGNLNLVFDSKFSNIGTVSKRKV